MNDLNNLSYRLVQRNLFYVVSISIIIILIIQYILVNYVTDLALYLDDFIQFLLTIGFTFYSFKKKPIVGICFLVFALIGWILMPFYSTFFMAFLDFLWMAKAIIFFYGFYYFLYQLSFRQLERIENIILFIFKFTLVYGILQWIMYFLFRKELPMLGVSYVQGIEELFSDRFAIRRVNSIFGFHLWFAYLCTIFGVYLFYFKRYFFTILCIIGLLCAFSRMAIGLFFLGLIFVLIKRRKKNIRLFLVFTFIVFIIFIFYQWQEIITYYNIFWGGYNNKAIKMLGIQRAIELFIQNPFGYGFGSFGTKYSFGSVLNGNLDLAGRTSGIESLYSILLIQTGLFGTFFYVFPFLLHFFQKRESRYLMGILLVLPCISSLYNPILLAMCCLLVVNMERLYSDNFNGIHRVKNG